MTSHKFRQQANDMENMQTPEGKLIGDAQKRLHISSRKAAEELGISDTRWRNIVNGYQAVGRGDQIKVVAPAETLARMASIVEVTPEELTAVGREDAAMELKAHRGRSLRPKVTDNRAALARLIQEELDTSRRGPQAVVAGWPVGRQRSFYDWRDGSVAPLRKSRPLLEEALGWRPGVVTEILEAPVTREFTLSEVRDWGRIPEPGAVRARDLSTDDLLMELTRRVGALQEIADRAKEDELRGASNVVRLHGEQPHYDLAASDEHVPGEDDRD